MIVTYPDCSLALLCFSSLGTWRMWCAWDAEWTVKPFSLSVVFCTVLFWKMFFELISLWIALCKIWTVERLQFLRLWRPTSQDTSTVCSHYVCSWMKQVTLEGLAARTLKHPRKPLVMLTSDEEESIGTQVLVESLWGFVAGLLSSNKSSTSGSTCSEQLEAIKEVSSQCLPRERQECIIGLPPWRALWGTVVLLSQSGKGSTKERTLAITHTLLQTNIYTLASNFNTRQLLYPCERLQY